MIADDGNPILMDFGSTLKARIKIDNRQQALLQQVGFRIYVMEIYATRTNLGNTFSRILPLNKVPWPIALRNSLM